MSNLGLMSKEALLPVQTVARKTGLTAHVIRAWELRYGAVEPRRSPTGHRRYSDADVQRLLLLRRAVGAGHSIGTIAHLPTAKIVALAAEQGAAPPKIAKVDLDVATNFHDECLAAVRALNQAALVRSLRRAAVSLGHQGLLRRVIAPLAERIGEQWWAGEMNAAHEHFFLAAVKMFLGEVAQQFAPNAEAPVLISATPSGQHHELGAFMAAISALHFGWNAIYLGASLPAADIAGACLQTEARAVVLSIIYPTDDPRLPAEIRMLRAALPQETAIVLGGRAAASYRPALKGANPIFVSDLADMAGVLDALRSGRPRAQRS